MPNNYILNHENNGEVEFKNLVLNENTGVDYDSLDLGNPVETIDSDNNTNTQLLVTNGNNRKIIYKYNRLKPVNDDVFVSLKVNRETNAEKITNDLKSLKVQLSEVVFVLEAPKNDGTRNVVKKECSSVEELVDNDLRYYKKLTLKAKENSKSLYGSSEIIIDNTSTRLDLVGFKSEENQDGLEVDNSKNSYDNFIDLLNRNNFIRDNVLNSDKNNVRSITDIEKVEPSVDNNNRNTVGIIKHVLDNGAIVSDEVSWDRVDLNTIDSLKNITISNDYINNGYLGIYDFINKHISEHIVENTNTKKLTNNTQQTEIFIEGVASVDDIINKIQQDGFITIKAREGSLVYFGSINISIAVDAEVIILDGFVRGEFEVPQIMKLVVGDDNLETTLSLIGSEYTVNDGYMTISSVKLVSGYSGSFDARIKAVLDDSVIPYEGGVINIVNGSAKYDVDIVLPKETTRANIIVEKLDNQERFVSFEFTKDNSTLVTEVTPTAEEETDSEP